MQTTSPIKSHPGGARRSRRLNALNTGDARNPDTSEVAALKRTEARAPSASHALAVSFVGRKEEAGELQRIYAQRQHALIVGPAGIGKTALLRQVRQSCPLLLCEETSSLRRICDCLERDLGWKHYKLNVVERKNRLVEYLARRNQPVVFDHVALTPPRVARFMTQLAERIPVWIACRSTLAHDIGHVWQYIFRFVRVELPPLLRSETRVLVEASADAGRIQVDAKAHVAELHRFCKGNPRVLEELLIELAARRYDMDKPFGRQLLDLDRRIHEAFPPSP